MDSDRLLTLSGPVGPITPVHHQPRTKFTEGLFFLFASTEDVTKQRSVVGESLKLVWGSEDRDSRAEITVVAERIVMWCGGLSVQRLHWYLPGIPQGTSHRCASLIPPSPVEPHISSLFSVWLKHSCNPLSSTSSSHPPLRSAKRAKENKDEA